MPRFLDMPVIDITLCCECSYAQLSNDGLACTRRDCDNWGVLYKEVTFIEPIRRPAHGPDSRRANVRDRMPRADRGRRWSFDLRRKARVGAMGRVVGWCFALVMALALMLHDACRLSLRERL